MIRLGQIVENEGVTSSQVPDILAAAGAAHVVMLPLNSMLPFWMQPNG
jgi:hypothetical protein